VHPLAPGLVVQSQPALRWGRAGALDDPQALLVGMALAAAHAAGVVAALAAPP